MNAPFFPVTPAVRWADPADRRVDAFLHDQPQATPFHASRWLAAVEAATGHRARLLVAEQGGRLVGVLPLSEIHSPIFGRVLASTGFAVSGGVLVEEGVPAEPLWQAATELATRLSCPSIELRGGAVPPDGLAGWTRRSESHCGFVTALAASDEAQLLAIPRKQRAEVRKGLEGALTVTIGSGPRDRAAHYAVYAESVRNLGTPVFPRALFAAVLDRFGTDADILTVWSGPQPVASVLSLYHRGLVMPYWGGGTRDARPLRANDRMYFELMRHARARGCHGFDFGRSKTGSGAYHFKRNWGFTPEPLVYASWTASGQLARDADPTSDRHRALIAAWQRLPLRVANRVGPWIARGLG
ncbi:FemAB family XrtA/PEP-CTERM system-associated protein [Novosphingobium piscinae]|uniref:FemAB family PEP-CTERM system-associated protein n=1 Tax=Novosphingobium piscinae TaxID=1507448 RepID=A0A7X1FZ18_9SPHN|nr:FemAB family XrtA/PEP-CTERM system-associated protein [Novosphingobium piscinae]MBC2669591.1 FemAB family PEP-CTERM system-associated protein [Novosphingobium piscinae]